jgi:uncharacterized membrane protein YphA (DoxX/SURF4 family)
MANLKLGFIDSLSFFFRLFLAAIFILSGLTRIPYPWSKALDPLMVESFSIFTFIPLEGIHWYGRLLPWIGFIVSPFLILGLCLRFVSAITIFIISGFLISNSIFLHFGIPCACMGDILQVLPYAIAFDVLLLGMAIWVFVNGGGVRLYRVPSKGATI